jgi:hypothetical protein
MQLFGGLSDFKTTPAGDITISNGDLQEVNGVDWFIQEVNKILKSSTDWYYFPNAGAGLERFYGQNNTRAVASQIQDLIKGKIERQGIHFPATIDVKVVPISRDEIKVYINLNYNQQVISVSNLIFDLQKGSLQETEEIAKNETQITPIKHPYASRFL